jgi:hypothetical protein
MDDRLLVPRRIVAVALLLVALVLLASLAVGMIEVANTPTPQVIEAVEGPASIEFATDRTQFVFPGDCSRARWEVAGIRTVHFYSYPMTGTGKLTVCHGDAPYLRVRLQDGTEHVYTLERDVLFLHPLAIGEALLALAAGGLAVYLDGGRKPLSTRRGQ